VSPTASPTVSPTVFPTVFPTVLPTATATQPGAELTTPTLIGAAIVGIIAVALMIGFYYTTRRM
jgi:hypothetical protein